MSTTRLTDASQYTSMDELLGKSPTVAADRGPLTD